MMNSFNGIPPRPNFTITNPNNKQPQHIAPFLDYDYFGPMWDRVPFFNSNTNFEDWTTTELMTQEQLGVYGAYYVGGHFGDMYAFSLFTYYVHGEFMPVFKKITGYEMFKDFKWMRITRKEHKRGYATKRHFRDEENGDGASCSYVTVED